MITKDSVYIYIYFYIFKREHRCRERNTVLRDRVFGLMI